MEMLTEKHMRERKRKSNLKEKCSQGKLKGRRYRPRMNKTIFFHLSSHIIKKNLLTENHIYRNTYKPACTRRYMHEP